VTSAASERPVSAVLGRRVVALGGGHGLAASLSALRRVTTELTAVVTVADNGGSSGRLRDELDVLPPGDLRQALAALCGDDEWGRTWAAVLQHRFASDGALHDHALGNLLIVALWELLGDAVGGLDWVGRLLGAQGRVLPMSAVPLDITAEVLGNDPAEPDALTTVRGQVAAATATGDVVRVSLDPEDPPACEESLEAVRTADWVVLGPGSWFTSVIPHLLVPQLRDALQESSARKLVVLNLVPQAGETEGFSPERHLEVLAHHAPRLGVDVVLADRGQVDDEPSLGAAAAALGARLVVDDVASVTSAARHDTLRLAAAFDRILGSGDRRFRAGDGRAPGRA
jgi:uncharacterized cofD-like protein